MPLLDSKVSKKVKIACLIEESNALLADQYAAFLGISAEEVVNKSLGYVFENDKEFREYRKEKAPQVEKPSLAVERAAPAAGKERGGGKPQLAIAK